MQGNRHVRDEIDFAKTMKEITQVYEELSVIRMQKIRDSVLKTRYFLGSLASVYQNVKHSHKKWLAQITLAEKESEELSPFTMLPKNGKKLVVLLSANEKLNGDINNKVFEAFFNYIQNNECDIMIIGRIGREIYQDRKWFKTYTYFEIPDDETKLEDLKKIIYYIVNYEYVNIFYGKFESMLSQVTVNENISGNENYTSNKISKELLGNIEDTDQFLFEPSLDKLHKFFETQFFSAVFKQTILESQLARYASRIKAMDDSLQHIDKRIEQFSLVDRKLRKSKLDNNQTERLAGMNVWK